MQSAGPGGQVVVQTAQGNVTLDLARQSLATLLKAGSEVTLEIRNTSTQPSQLLLTLPQNQAGAGQAAQNLTQRLTGHLLNALTGGNSQAQSAAQQPATVTTASTAAPQTALALGRVVQATVLPGSPATAASNSTAQQGAAQQAGAPQIQSQASQAQTALANAASAAQRSNPQAATLNAQSATSSSTQATALQPGSTLAVRIVAINQQQAPLAPTGLQSSTNSPATVTLTGTISGTTQSGQPVLITPNGSIALDAKSELRPGTTVRLEVLSHSRGGDIDVKPAPLAVLGREWPALDASVRALSDQVGPTVAQTLTDQIPRPGPAMTAGVLFFMAAVKGGDVASWFRQEAAQLLESSGRAQLLGTLSDDFQTLQRASEPNEAGWRSFVIPVGPEHGRPIKLLARREGKRKDADGNEREPGTAFLVDLDLTNLGPFRMDGVVRNDLVDLLIRTVTPLPTPYRHDIQALFDTALERTGIEGNLRFRSTPQLPPLPVEDFDVASAGSFTSVVT